jgi:hypothetical protein
MTKKRGYILRDFNDASTGESFTAGAEPVLIDAGQFANFEAAGLVSAVPPEGANEIALVTRAPKPRAPDSLAPAAATVADTQP